MIQNGLRLKNGKPFFLPLREMVRQMGRRQVFWLVSFFDMNDLFEYIANSLQKFAYLS